MRVRTVIDFIVDETAIPAGAPKPDVNMIREGVKAMVAEAHGGAVSAVMISCDIVSEDIDDDDLSSV